MGKDTEKHKYVHAAIPRANARLIAYIENEHLMIGTAESQVLVRLANERLQQLDGLLAVPTMSIVTPVSIPAMNGNGARAETSEPRVASITVPTTSGGATDEELEDYGDPD